MACSTPCGHCGGVQSGPGLRLGLARITFGWGLVWPGRMSSVARGRRPLRDLLPRSPNTAIRLHQCLFLPRDAGPLFDMAQGSPGPVHRPAQHVSTTRWTPSMSSRQGFHGTPSPIWLTPWARRTGLFFARPLCHLQNWMINARPQPCREARASGAGSGRGMWKRPLDKASPMALRPSMATWPAKSVAARGSPKRVNLPPCPVLRRPDAVKEEPSCPLGNLAKGQARL